MTAKLGSFLLFFSAGVCAAATNITWSRDVAPIVQKNCVPCHREGQAGPFPLDTFAAARRHASQLVAVTGSRYMPPWLPGPGNLFEDARRLSPAEIATIAAWVRAGSPEGDPSAAPPLPPPPEWQLGPPDLILQVPAAFSLPASGEDVFRNFVIPAPAGPPRWVRAIELYPGNPKLVHHANIVLDRARTLRARESADGHPGFPGMDVATESGNTFDPDSHFLFYKPGSPPESDPPDMAWRLDSETDLVLNLHLRPSGKPESVRPSLGLYFTATPPARFPMLLQLEHDSAIDIPPGASAFSITDHLTLPVACDLLRIYPHAHYLGKHITAWAVLPDGSRKELITVEHWNLDWQGVFTYRRPIHLPKGTVVHMRAVYDNSAANPRNPNHPPLRVRSGNRASDEMGHVWLQVLPTAVTKQDPRAILQEAVMERRLEKDPADLLAHYNLGAFYESQARHSDAIPQFEAALRSDPNHAAARNALAAALLSSGRNTDALREWRQTVALSPAYAPAHFNLARLLAALDDVPRAELEYRAYLALHPEDPEAHLNLGTLYIASQQFDLALPELAKACELDPANADARTDYGTLLARQGKLAEAIVEFEAALRLDPANQVAAQNLRRARGNSR